MWYNAPMANTALRDYIAKRETFVWYVDDPRTLSDEAIVEATLNYGDWDDVQEVIRILGIEKVAHIFKDQTRRTRSNYYPKTRNFFSLYFDKYASHA